MKEFILTSIIGAFAIFLYKFFNVSIPLNVFLIAGAVYVLGTAIDRIQDELQRIRVALEQADLSRASFEQLEVNRETVIRLTEICGYLRERSN